MTRSATMVQVFVASPSDVGDERQALESIIDELNLVWGRSLGVVFELIRWESKVRPAYGKDPQAIINDQIGDDYDVFIGILWSRIGTPTPRALSGTLEEFERAVDRFRLSKKTPEIMVYFKDTPISPSKLDVDQIRKIQDFRRKIEGEGIHSTFEDLASFESSMRAHLSTLAQKFSTNQRHSLPLAEDSSQLLNSEDEDDLGFLDHIEIYEARIAEMTQALNVMNDATKRVGQQMNARAGEIRAAGPGGLDSRTARKAVKKSAEDFVAYGEILANQVPVLSSSREAALQALSNALVLYEDFDTEPEQLRDLGSGIKELQNAARRSRISLSGFRHNMSGIPRLTSELNRAKKVIVKQLDVIDSEMERIDQNISNIIESIDRLSI